MTIASLKQSVKSEIPSLLLIICWFVFFILFSWDKCGILSSIDQSRELLVSYFLSSGKVLYKDIFYVYGPLPQYFIVFFINIFGYSFTLYRIIGIGLCFAFIMLYYSLSRTVLNKVYSTLLLLLSIPLLVFNDYGAYIFPYSFNALFASIFFMVSVLLLVFHLKTSKDACLYGVCILSALMFFVKQEYFLYNMALIGAYLLFFHLFKIDFSSQKSLREKALFFFKSISYVRIIKLTGFVLLLIFPGVILCGQLMGYNVFIKGLMQYEMLFSKECKYFLLNENLSIFSLPENYKFFLSTAFIPTFLFFFITSIMSLFVYAFDFKRRNRVYLYLILIVVIAFFSVPLFGGISLMQILLMQVIQYSKYIFSGFNLWLVILLFYLLANYERSQYQTLIIIVFASLLVSTRSFLNLELTSYGLFYLPFTLILFVYIFSSLLPEFFTTNLLSKIKVNWDFAFKILLIILLLFYSYITIATFISNKYKIESPQGTHYVFNEALNVIHYKYIEIGEFIKENTVKTDTVLVYPADSLIYIYANRLAASKHYHLFPGTVSTVKIEDTIIQEIKVNKPKFIVISNQDFLKIYNVGKFGSKDFNIHLYHWIISHYRLVKKYTMKESNLVLDLYQIKN